MKKNLVMLQDVSNLNEHERVKLIYQLGIDKSILIYLITRLQNLSIQIGADKEENIIDLMNKGFLEGWCWQTTESSIVFFDDNDSIERGNLKFSTRKNYWHSWICFQYDGVTWVFDPCLQIIVEKNIYYHVFEIVEVAAVVKAKLVKEDLMYRINHREEKSYEPNSFCARFLAPYISERQKSETHVSGSNDVKSPMYRNNTGYIATIDNGNISTLMAHYYYNG